MAEYKGKLLKGLFVSAKNIIMNSGKNYEDEMLSPSIVDETTITSETTIGSINFKLYSNGMKQVRIASNTMPTTSYTSLSIIPDAFKPLVSVTLMGVSWGGGNVRPMALLADGRVQVYASTNAGLDITAIYI